MYNKLYTKILDSSIWLEPNPTRIVWITFLAAMDEDGFAQFSSVRNLANRAMVAPEEAEAAVRTLEAPDPESASKEHEGRRIERVDGGWMILNAGLYRDIVTRTEKLRLNRERVARHRARKKQRSTALNRAQPSSAGKACNAIGNAPVMQSEAYSEAYSDAYSDADKRARASRPSRRCPEGFEVPAGALEKIRTECPNVDLEFETRRFRDYEFATAKSDWLATWRNWMRKAQESAGRAQAPRLTKYDEIQARARARAGLDPGAPSPAAQFFLGAKP